ncbi:helix-turn-helix domain-containing protein [Phaeocystidibacter luteus]|uniref:Helix-turn-helix transcriptional regulator n=1 Tax=Phaeocystidibacter luteus TaxID=911197 RepID=A0A6N6RM20_9FLAO|nr:helix-turn-helix transcriptional regulator [Phaeocystidibacter luteus]KAB2814588.1 helix-turn-helix transcriptional regulator [Phaeocystidibacter luteus]
MRFNTPLFAEFVKASDYTQREFAEKYDMSYMRLRRILEGESQLDAQQLANISRDFGLSMYHFFQQDQNEIPVDESNPLLYGQKVLFERMKVFIEKYWEPESDGEKKAKTKIIEDLVGFST